MPVAAGPIAGAIKAQPVAPGKEFSAWRFPDGYRGILLPVRKSLTKKSGIIGLPAFAGQDSLVYGGEAEDPGYGRKNLYGPENVLSLNLKAGNDNHERVIIMPTTFKEPLEPSFSLAERLAGLTSVSACYQCKKCSAGCPLTFAMDFYPDQVIRLALLGQEAQVLGCRTIWVCSSCETCTTRCPNNIDIAGVMDWLKEEAISSGQASPQPEVTRFHQTFLDTVLYVRRAPVGAAALGPLSMAARRDPGKTQVRRPGCRPADGLGAGPAPPAGPAPAPSAEGR